MDIVAEYVYDTWGSLISTTDSQGNDVTDVDTHIGVINPYRYRGYRYDNETGLYYLNSRYYNPQWGRFLNCDGITGQMGILLSHNLFAYCGNNPINNCDPNGYLYISINTMRVSTAINYQKNGASALPQPKSVVEKVVVQNVTPKKNTTVTPVPNGTVTNYNVTTTINKTNYNYTINFKGTIKYSFTENKYPIIDRNKLITAMYSTAKEINSNYLHGRTIPGLDREFKLHYWAYRVRYGYEAAMEADMGGIDVDDNAAMFENKIWFKVLGFFAP